MKPWIFVFCLVVFIAASGTAEAKSWTVDYANSSLGFTGTQSGDAFEGSFKKFTVDINFDPDHPEQGKITANIDITSAATGDGERDSMLPQSTWFYTEKFPQAEFVSSQIRKTGPNAYEADGTLTIKGIAKDIQLPFSLIPEEDHWRAQGKIKLVRTDFHIGEGQWADDKTVRLSVDVTVNVSAKPQS